MKKTDPQMKKTSKIIFGLILFILIIVTACTAEPEQSVSVSWLSEKTLTPTNTQPVPVDTTVPSDTPCPAATPCDAQTETPEPTFAYNPDDISIRFGGFLDTWRYFFAFQFPAEVHGDFYVLIDEAKQYTCEVIPNYPDRLYCSGPLHAVEEIVQVDLYQDCISSPVFSEPFLIPPLE